MENSISSSPIDTISSNYMHVIPNSHFWNSLEILSNYITQTQGISKEVREHLLIGFTNMSKRGYDIRLEPEGLFSKDQLSSHLENYIDDSLIDEILFALDEKL